MTWQKLRDWAESQFGECAPDFESTHEMSTSAALRAITSASGCAD